MTDQQLIETARRAFKTSQYAYPAPLCADLGEILNRVDAGMPVSSNECALLRWVAGEQIEIEKPAQVTGAITW